LALLACAFLPVLAAAQPGGGHPGDDLLIPLTRNEIRRLFTGLCQKLPAPGLQLRWSRWRRRHQATARRCHHQRRAVLTPAHGGKPGGTLPVTGLTCQP
jgi:hypothetical protein